MHCCHPRIPLSGAPSRRVGKIRKMSNFPPEKCLKMCHLQWSQTLKRDNGWFAMTSIGNLPIRYYSVIDLGFIFSSLTYILKFWFARLPGNCRPHGLWITVCKHSQVTDLLKSSPWKAVEKKRSLRSSQAAQRLQPLLLMQVWFQREIPLNDSFMTLLKSLTGIKSRARAPSFSFQTPR